MDVTCEGGGRVVEGYVAGGVVWVSNISSALFCFYSFLLCIFRLFFFNQECLQIVKDNPAQWG